MQNKIAIQAGEEIEMDALVRGIAIFLEWLVLAAIFYHMLKGAKLVLGDLGMPAKYMKGVTVALTVVGSLLGVFLVAHLTTFYPW